MQVALHVGPDSWQQLQGAFLDLAVAAVNGDSDVAAALLLAFPDLAAALGHEEATVILVPVMLELLHTRLVRASVGVAVISLVHRALCLELFQVCVRV